MWQLNYKESWEPKNWCFWTVVLEQTLGRSLDCKEIKPVHLKGRKSVLNIYWKDQCWSWNSNTLAIWCEGLTYLKRPWCWERLKAGREGDDRGSDGWMTSPTQWTWVWASSGNWWWTWKPGMLQYMVSQRVGDDWMTLFCLDYKEIKKFNPKGNQPWIFLGRTDAEAKAQILWPPEAKSRLIGKKPWSWER